MKYCEGVFMNKCIAGMLHRVFNLVLSTAYLIVVTTIIGMGNFHFPLWVEIISWVGVVCHIMWSIFMPDSRN